MDFFFYFWIFYLFFLDFNFLSLFLKRCGVDEKEWTYTGHSGIAALVQSEILGGAVVLFLVDFKSNSVVYSQEFYENFEYTVLTPFFHSFECDVSRKNEAI